MFKKIIVSLVFTMLLSIPFANSEFATGSIDQFSNYCGEASPSLNKDNNFYCNGKLGQERIKVSEINSKTSCGGFYKTYQYFTVDKLTAILLHNGHCEGAVEKFRYNPIGGISEECKRWGGTGNYKWYYHNEDKWAWSTRGVMCEIGDSEVIIDKNNDISNKKSATVTNKTTSLQTPPGIQNIDKNSIKEQFKKKYGNMISNLSEEKLKLILDKINIVKSRGYSDKVISQLDILYLIIEEELNKRSTFDFDSLFN